MSQKKKAPLGLRILVYFVLFLIVSVVFVYFYWNYLISPVSSDSSKKEFIINPGESISYIGSQLKQENLIHSDLAFKILLKFRGNPANIQAGKYQLSSSFTTGEIIKALQMGRTDKLVKIIEGLRDEEVANILSKSLQIDKSQFLAIAKEGYMFPDSYYFDPNASASEVAQIMEKNFSQKYSVQLQNQIEEKGLSAQQGVILASIVEREARTEKVRTQVASILLKRLKIGMPLQVDSTVQYAKDTFTLNQNGTLDQFWRPVTQNDYQLQSPYNTYLYPGLPPAPICNPSLSSLQAVANADPNTPYLYYYHDSEGNSYYAKTLKEHNANVAAHP